MRLSETGESLELHDYVWFGRRFGHETKGDCIRRMAHERAEEEEKRVARTSTTAGGGGAGATTATTAAAAAATTAPDSVGFLTRIGRHVGAAPGTRSIAQHIRDALSEGKKMFSLL